ncbi:hypothetical protein WJX72_006223 [[Myrmecia] bisecta]|uniref:Anticodon-binding domain-containing protein n=1 Tax=[Myrmecia] bisecta TaxID=41462 RepID=A0AAW1PTK3_9CHLO
MGTAAVTASAAVKSIKRKKHGDHAASAAGEAAGGAKTAKKRRRKAGSAERAAALAALTPDERARREHQRALRERALQLRAAGKDYRPRKRQKTKDMEVAGPKGQVGQIEETGTRPDGDVQVIIVPIYWNKREREKADVMAAAEGVEAALRAEGLAAGLDTTNVSTPGQKFRFWEEKGVKVRIELGPRDADSGECILALCTKPGEVAQKTKIKVGAPLLKAVREALGLPEAGSAPATTKPAAPSPAAVAVAHATTKHAQHAQKRSARRGASGDDLGDDFGLAVTDGAEEAAAAGKKGKKKKRGGGGPAGEGLGFSGLGRGPAAALGKSAGKVVKF